MDSLSTLFSSSWSPLIGQLIILLPLELFFGYVILRGLLLTGSALMTSGKKGVMVLCFAVTFIALFGNRELLEGFLEKTQRKLSVSFKEETASSDPLRENTVFIPGRTSHTICLILGILAANWLRSVIQISSLPLDSQKSVSRILSFVLHFLFSWGCLFWWWLWLPQLVTNYLTTSMTLLEGITLTFTHTLSFSGGLFLYQDYYKRQLDKRGDDEVQNHYIRMAINFMVVPLVWRALTSRFGVQHLLFLIQVPLIIHTFMSGIPKKQLTSGYTAWITLVALTCSLFMCSSVIEEPINLSGVFTLFNDFIGKSSYSTFILGQLTGGIFIYYLVKRSLSKTSAGPDCLRTKSGVSRDERSTKFPPTHPNGWYKLVDSDDLKPGDLKYVSLLGKEFAVFRETDGEKKARVLNAYCPHLGANIALGKVVNNTIQCPFHGWQWRGDGSCANIPYSKCEPPAGARIQTYEVYEYANMVCVWYHAQGEPPSWTLMKISEFENGEYEFRAKQSYRAEMHMQDIVENAADPAHFDVLHHNLALPFFSFLSPFFYIRHDITWRAGVENAVKHLDKDTDWTQSETPHLSSFIDYAELCSIFSDKPLFPGMAYALVTFVGPTIHVYRFVTKHGTIILLKTFTPESNLLQEVTDIWFAEKKVPTILFHYVKLQAYQAFLDDMEVWGSKTYSFKPLVIKEDGPMHKLRRWYRQFYTEKRAIQLEGEDAEKNNQPTVSACTKEFEW